jgi:hypothetical protein
MTNETTNTHAHERARASIIHFKILSRNRGGGRGGQIKVNKNT